MIGVPDQSERPIEVRPPVLLALAEARCGEASQVVERSVLEPAVMDGGMWLDAALVIPATLA